MNLFYFTLICENVDMFDGKVIHINQKVKNIEEVHQIVMNNLDKYPDSHWELYPNSIKIS